MNTDMPARADGLLRLFLLVLVLLDLVFVQITGAASRAWLIPLFALTLLSPLLTRWMESKLYRFCWGLGLFAIFGMLLRDALDSGIAHLLEDGLLLAAYCQVHLLNNLNRRQKPDLLFFNSFLIPLVTSFFSQDLSYSLVFLLYAPVLIVSMQLASIVGSGCKPSEGRLRAGRLGAGLMLRVSKNGLRHAFITMLATAGIFLYWPRNFERQGLVQAYLERQHGQTLAEVDFSEEIKLGSVQNVLASNQIVMKVSLEQGNQAGVPTHWRGATFNDYASEEWTAVRHSRHRGPREMNERWTLRGGTRQFYQRGKRALPGESLRLVVELVSPRVTKLFHPLGTQTLRVHRPIVPESIHPLVDGTLRYSPGSQPVLRGKSFGYSIEVPWLTAQPGGNFAAKDAWKHAPFLHLPRRAGRKTVAELVDRLLGLEKAGLEKTGKEREQHEIVATLERYLAENYSYLPPGAKGGAKSIDEFLEGGHGAHCEYFATSLTMMLRSRNIPCRLASGYYSNEWDYEGKQLIFRKKHAHAWVEVYDPTIGWYVVDPSPTGLESVSDDEAGLWREIMGGLQNFWRKLTNFDDKARARAVDWLLALPARSLATVLRSPFTSTLLLAVLALGIWKCRSARRSKSPPAVLSYLDCLRATGLGVAAGETPRELLERARGLDLPEQKLEKLCEATRLHEAERYSLD